MHLVANESGARLTFQLPDGRSAERQLRNPSELGPAVEALRVTGLQLPAAPAPPAPPAPPAVEPDAPVDLPDADEKDSGPEWILAFASGARAGHEALVSPVLIGSVAFAFDRWELGAALAYEPRYFDLRRRSVANQQSGTLGLGVGLGRREPLGNLAIIWGARVAFAALTDHADVRSSPAGSSSAPNDDEGGALELRLGGYIGLVLPVSTSLRVRTEIGIDAVGANRARTAIGGDPAAEVPVTPEWALCAIVGLELTP